ncbi:MAG: epoxyqueuosine reductase QueH [Oscillospiraceae bacterium]|nr:epoxyqueuosine reductase QueH [Oscillospiraceae bacterium]
MATGVLLSEIFSKIESSGVAPRLLLHCCCAPCASHVIEYLSPSFVITALFYNPNIQPQEEYDKRAGEMRRLLDIAGYPNVEDLILCEHSGSAFDNISATFPNEPEGDLGCYACIDLRLREAATRAKTGRYDFFATTLSVSPHKNALLINEIGVAGASNSGINYLVCDFKKQGGFQRSVELSKRYGLYRQSYCGCLLRLT